MTLVPVMWSVWGGLVLIFILLKVYIGRLNRDESDQIVLDEVFEHVKAENDAIAAKASRVEHIEQIVMWVLIASTVFVIVYYIIDIIHQLQ